MMALAEFEPEQTAERTRDATAAGSARGLCHGGQLIGYDLDANRKGALVLNEAESTLRSFAFDTYLERGSIAETAVTLNRRGHRSKQSTSQRGHHHAGGEFSTVSARHLRGAQALRAEGADAPFALQGRRWRSGDRFGGADVGLRRRGSSAPGHQTFWDTGVAPRVGLEPTTLRLTAARSTD